MRFHSPTAEVYVPDQLPVEQALARTTHMTVAAHQDDIEIMSAAPILDCYQREDRWFTGVVVSDGRGSPRDGIYSHYSDEEMRLVRFKEQFKAAFVGEYAAQVILDYPSKTIKDGAAFETVQDIAALLRAARPQVVYTHNLADKHDTHVATALRTLAAIRALPREERPERVYGCEVWRSLDWVVDQEKVSFDLSHQESLQAALLGVFDSQITGGKRYDLASMGRRRANATYFEAHGVDLSTGVSFGMDLTPLIVEPFIDIPAYVLAYIQRFMDDVSQRFDRVG